MPRYWQLRNRSGHSYVQFSILLRGRFWPGTEISAVDLVAGYLPFSSVEREQSRCNNQRQVVAGCTHWDFKPERQLYDGEGAVQLNTDHRSGSLPSCLMTPRPTKERICVIAMAFNCVNRSGTESP